MSGIITVSQLNRYMYSSVKGDKKLQGILVRGEISNFTDHIKTGNLYFTLKEDNSAVSAVMFSDMTRNLNFAPAAGMKVIVSASVQVYERDGRFQLKVSDMQPDGIGAAYLAFEQLKRKLSEEGLFDAELKKPVPAFPRKIGIVTSPDAAALQDMLNIISRRCPAAEITVYPCLVQGESAPDSICAALKRADARGNDLIITGRGGGSLEDLMAFNSEKVARAVFACKTPVISAVGHETDTTICDLAADMRAPTPSAAAELAVPELAALMKYVDSLEYTLNESFKAMLSVKRHRTEIALQRLNALMPARRIENSRVILNEKDKRLAAAFKNRLALERSALSEKTAALDNLSPLKIMSRGYSLVYKDSGLIKSAGELQKGDNITIRLSDGTVSAAVIAAERKDTNEI